MLLTRTWPYGTRKRVKVLSIEFLKGMRIMACQEVDGAQEGFILMEGPNAVATAEGEIGEIVFCQGGERGAHWRYHGECIPF